jgi:hypothetical protein
MVLSASEDRKYKPHFPKNGHAWWLLMTIQIYTIVVWRSFWWSLAVEGWMFWLTGGLVYLIAIHGIASLFDH